MKVLFIIYLFCVRLFHVSAYSEFYFAKINVRNFQLTIFHTEKKTMLRVSSSFSILRHLSPRTFGENIQHKYVAIKTFITHFFDHLLRWKFAFRKGWKVGRLVHGLTLFMY